MASLDLWHTMFLDKSTSSDYLTCIYRFHHSRCRTETTKPLINTRCKCKNLRDIIWYHYSNNICRYTVVSMFIPGINRVPFTPGIFFFIYFEYLIISLLLCHSASWKEISFISLSASLTFSPSLSFSFISYSLFFHNSIFCFLLYFPCSFHWHPVLFLLILNTSFHFSLHLSSIYSLLTRKINILVNFDRKLSQPQI